MAAWRMAALAAVGLVVLASAACRGGESAEAFCLLVADRAGLAALTGGFDPGDPDSAIRRLQAMQLELAELRAAAPDEIRGDLDLQDRALRTLIEALREVPPGDPAGAVEAVRAAQEQMDGVHEAGARLEAWTEENCR